MAVMTRQTKLIPQPDSSLLQGNTKQLLKKKVRLYSPFSSLSALLNKGNSPTLFWSSFCLEKASTIDETRINKIHGGVCMHIYMCPTHMHVIYVYIRVYWLSTITLTLQNRAI